MTWYDDYRSGKLGPYTKLGTASQTFSDAVSEWHHSDSELELHEFLGLTWEQYCFITRFSHIMEVPTPEFAGGFYAGYIQGHRDFGKEQ